MVRRKGREKIRNIYIYIIGKPLKEDICSSGLAALLHMGAHMHKGNSVNILHMYIPFVHRTRITASRATARVRVCASSFLNLVRTAVHSFISEREHGGKERKKEKETFLTCCSQYSQYVRHCTYAYSRFKYTSCIPGSADENPE